MFYLFNFPKSPNTEKNSHDPTSTTNPRRITWEKEGVTGRMLGTPYFIGRVEELRKWLVKRKEGYFGVFIVILFYQCFTFFDGQKKGKTQKGLREVYYIYYYY